MNKKQNVVIFGAGRSTYNLIEYLSQKSTEININLSVIDKEAREILKNLDGFQGDAIDADLTDRDFRQKTIKGADLVISMLPARFHILVAEDCVAFKKNMVTASYVTPEMEFLDKEAKKSDIILLNEVGLDPGIDHMSAMKIIHGIQENGGANKSI